MADIAAIRSGLAANLDSLSDLGIQVSAYVLGAPSPPAVQILTGPIDFNLASGRGVELYNFVVQVLVALTTDATPQALLDSFMTGGTHSIRNMIEADRTLGGAAQTLSVEGTSGIQTITMEGRGQMLYCEWRVQVLAAG